MENRVIQLQYALLREIDHYATLVPERDEEADWERVHMASSARLGWLMAMQRGVDPEISACACAIHDYGRIITGKQAGHAQAGYAPVKAFLETLSLFTPQECEALALAAKNHSSKSVIGTAVEEIVKDADVVDCFMSGVPFARDEQRLRYEKWASHMTKDDHCI